MEGDDVTEMPPVPWLTGCLAIVGIVIGSLMDQPVTTIGSAILLGLCLFFTVLTYASIQLSNRPPKTRMQRDPNDRHPVTRAAIVVASAIGVAFAVVIAIGVALGFIIAGAMLYLVIGWMIT